MKIQLCLMVLVFLLGCSRPVDQYSYTGEGLVLVDSLRIDRIGNLHFAHMSDSSMLLWDINQRELLVFNLQGEIEASISVPIDGPDSFGENLINASIYGSKIFALGVHRLVIYDFNGKVLKSLQLDSPQFLLSSRLDNNNLHILNDDLSLTFLSYLEGSKEDQSYYSNQQHIFQLDLVTEEVIPITGFPAVSLYLNEELYYPFQSTLFSQLEGDTLYFMYELENKGYKLSISDPQKVEVQYLEGLELKVPIGVPYGQQPDNYDFMDVNSTISGLFVSNHYIYVTFNRGVDAQKLQNNFPDPNKRDESFDTFIAVENRQMLFVFDKNGRNVMETDITTRGKLIHVDAASGLLYLSPSEYFSVEKDYEEYMVYRLGLE